MTGMTGAGWVGELRPLGRHSVMGPWQPIVWHRQDLCDRDMTGWDMTGWDMTGAGWVGEPTLRRGAPRAERTRLQGLC